MVMIFAVFDRWMLTRWNNCFFIICIHITSQNRFHLLTGRKSFILYYLIIYYAEAEVASSSRKLNEPWSLQYCCRQPRGTAASATCRCTRGLQGSFPPSVRSPTRNTSVTSCVHVRRSPGNMSTVGKDQTTFSECSEWTVKRPTSRGTAGCTVDGQSVDRFELWYAARRPAWFIIVASPSAALHGQRSTFNCSYFSSSVHVNRCDASSKCMYVFM